MATTKDLLKKKSKVTSPVIQSENQLVESAGRTVINFKDRLELLSNLIKTRNRNTKEIVKIFVEMKNNQELLKEQTGLTFKEVVSQYTDISKSQFYSLVGNYEFLELTNRIDLIDKVDYKVIEEIKKIDDQKLQKSYLDKAEDLTREDINTLKDRVRRADSVSPKVSDKVTDVSMIEQSKLKTDVTRRVEKIISTYESHIKQLNQKKKERDICSAQVIIYRIVISDLQELLKKYSS